MGCAGSAPHEAPPLSCKSFLVVINRSRKCDPMSSSDGGFYTLCSRLPSSITIKLVVGNTAGTQPFPPRRIFFNEPGRHKRSGTLCGWIAPLRIRGLLFWRHKDSYFERRNRQEFFIDQPSP